MRVPLALAAPGWRARHTGAATLIEAAGIVGVQVEDVLGLALAVEVFAVNVTITGDTVAIDQFCARLRAVVVIIVISPATDAGVWVER